MMSSAFKLICFDMDGVLFKDQNFWMELHKAYGTFKEGKILTDKYLHTNYDLLVREVVGKLWLHKDASVYHELITKTPYVPGVKAVLDHIRTKGWKIAIISASSVELARRLMSEHDPANVVAVYANELGVENGRISGTFIWPVGSGFERKAQILIDICAQEGITPNDAIFVGDGANDTHACAIAGWSVAFNPLSDDLRRVAKRVVVSETLEDIIPVLPD